MAKKDDLGAALTETAEEVRAVLAEVEEAAGDAAAVRRAEALVALNRIANQLAGVRKKLGVKAAKT